ncbi:UNVERIFIED_ORG: membrane-associated phospholipid phosphatase [Shinella zoogloeoides]|nr:membrane-associated phospholipid phosphatase [Shinella zoogloeoides]
MARELNRARIALFMVTALAGCGLLFLPFTKLVLDRGPISGILPSLLFIFGLGVYLHKRGMLVLRGLMEVLGCAVVISYAGIVWSYVAISLDHPLADTYLIALDRSIGFDWLSFVAVIDRIPWLDSALFAAYQSFMYQLLVIPLFLVASGLAVRGYMLVAGFGLLCMAASVISVWFPAVGAHVALAVDPASLKHLNPHFGYAFLDQFHSVRNDTTFLLTMNKAAGILTFPSVHAGAAFLCGWAAWKSKILRFPVGFLNIAMAMSAISHGSHYLVDVIAGILLSASIVLILDGLVSPSIRFRLFRYLSASGIR